jgi:hypothetical protein
VREPAARTPALRKMRIRVRITFQVTGSGVN